MKGKLLAACPVLVSCVLVAPVHAQAWLLTPLDNGYYRIHSGLQGRRWSLSGRPGGPPQLERTAHDVNQLWQVRRTGPTRSRPAAAARPIPNASLLLQGDSGHVLLRH